MGKRFILYGLAGFCMEVLWTGLFATLGGDIKMTGHTYIWMFPIYGLAVFLEPVHNRIRHLPLVLRGGVYMLLILLAEFITGMLLKLTIGVCPWDYSTKPLQIYGVITLAYAPAWFAVGLLFEKFHDFLLMIEGRISESKA